MMKQKTYAQLALLTLLTVSTCIVCAATHPLEDIRATAVHFVRSHFAADGAAIKVSANRLDSRLRLPQCQPPLQAYFPHATGSMARNTTVGVRCSGPRPWSIYVPVTIQVYRDIAVARQSLPQHKILTSGDFRMERLDVSKFSGAYIADPDKLIGKQLRRPVQMGGPLLSTMLKEPIAIKRGQRVTLLAKSQTFEVRMEAKALTDGAVGDKIRVQNLHSKRIIEGKLGENGLVFVN